MILSLLKSLVEKYRRRAKAARRRSCVHVFISTFSMTGSRQFCTRCHSIKDFQPWL